MLIDRVLGIKKAFNFTDGQRNFDKVFRSIVAKLGSINAAVEKPVVNKFRGLFGRLNQLINLFISEMLAIARVGGRRD